MNENILNYQISNYIQLLNNVSQHPYKIQGRGMQRDITYIVSMHTEAFCMHSPKLRIGNLPSRFQFSCFVKRPRKKESS